MVTSLLISIGALLVIFVLFLVISRTVNSIVNQLTKTEYLVQKDYDFHKEAQEIKRVIKENAEEDAARKR
ncbi:MAG: hypothetical protein PHC61_15215 [Chitinivibrionales bacterium]|nr:hypothetical protein [Chitinivibrionales bacterium]